MSSGEQEALRLADRMTAAEFRPSFGTANAAASTIRRLVAAREADRAAMRQAVDACDAARIALSELLMTRDPVVYADALRKVDAAISLLKERIE